MTPRSGSFGSDGIAERRAQRVLNEKVGDRLLPRRTSQRLKWLTRSLGSRGRERAEA
jgi:hypothetical protein